MSCDVLIIGAGAAGCMAAISAAREGAAVTLLDANEQAAKKLLATGNGRCNLTNRDQALSHYRSDDPDRVEAVFSAISAGDTLDFFRGLGLLVRERDGWVYPASMQAASVRKLLLNELRRLGVKEKYKETVRSVESVEGGYLAKTDSWSYEAKSLVICCGSPASDIAGASDAALRFAKDLSVPAKPFTPALVPLVTGDAATAKLAGLRAQAKVTLVIDKKPVRSEEGEVQFTANHISGIPVLQCSAAAAEALAASKKAELRLDFLPDFSEEELAGHLQHLLDAGTTKSRDLLAGILPDKLQSLFLPEIESDLSADALPALIRQIKDHAFPVRASAPVSEAQICGGGILLASLTDELEDPAHPGLFFAGECVNLAGDCGGYNLQWAWSSGRLAGIQAAARALS